MEPQPRTPVYPEAINFALASHDPYPSENTKLYWAAWKAARLTAWALLETARTLDLTPAQLETLRQTAAHIAPD